MPFQLTEVTKVTIRKTNTRTELHGEERERKYFDIACERIARAQAQGQLLPPEEPRQPVQEGLL